MTGNTAKARAKPAGLEGKRRRAVDQPQGGAPEAINRRLRHKQRYGHSFGA